MSVGFKAKAVGLEEDFLFLLCLVLEELLSGILSLFK